MQSFLALHDISADGYQPIKAFKPLRYIKMEVRIDGALCRLTQTRTLRRKRHYKNMNMKTSISEGMYMWVALIDEAMRTYGHDVNQTRIENLHTARG